MGLSYFFRLLATDAHNAGNPGLAWRWFGWWWLVWVVAYALIYALQLPIKGLVGNGWVRAFGIAVVNPVCAALLEDGFPFCIGHRHCSLPRAFRDPHFSA